MFPRAMKEFTWDPFYRDFWKESVRVVTGCNPRLDCRCSITQKVVERAFFRDFCEFRHVFGVTCANLDVSRCDPHSKGAGRFQHARPHAGRRPITWLYCRIHSKGLTLLTRTDPTRTDPTRTDPTRTDPTRTDPTRRGGDLPTSGQPGGGRAPDRPCLALATRPRRLTVSPEN